MIKANRCIALFLALALLCGMVTTACADVVTLGIYFCGRKTAEDGSENFPGWSLEALKYIYETRNAAANGHETLDTDASAVAAAAGDLVCERYVLEQNKIQVEVLSNLDKVTPAGAVLIVSYPRIEGATGLPARVWAITE